MYYFLGFKLMNDGLSRRKWEKKGRNTFLLALDGDVDFHPPAVQLLVDRMKKNPLVGAACGRIHPIGNGKKQFGFNAKTNLKSERKYVKVALGNKEHIKESVRKKPYYLRGFIRSLLPAEAALDFYCNGHGLRDAIGNKPYEYILNAAGR